MGKKGQHVVPRETGWAVLRSGAARASSLHRTQAEAIEAATRVARKQKTILYIHGADGLIRQRNAFGTDPQAPRS